MQNLETYIILAYLCNSFLNCLVGYKYERGETHHLSDSLQWKIGRKINNQFVFYSVAPKRISEPVREILAHVNKK